MGSLSSAGTWFLGLWRLAGGRIRADWRFLGGVWVLLSCATTLLASGVIYGDAVALGSLRAAIRAAPSAAQGVLVESGLTPAQVGTGTGPIESALRGALGGPGGSVTLELRSSSLVRIGSSGSNASQGLTMVDGVDDIASRAHLVGGRWATPGQQPLEADLTEAAATALGLGIGDRVPLADAGTPGADPNRAVVTLTVVGIVRPDAMDAAWGGDELDLAGFALLNGTTFRGPFFVDPADILGGTFAQLDARWRAVPDLDRLTADEIEPLRARIDALPGEVRRHVPAEGSVNISLQLAGLLDGVARSLQVARGAVLVLTLQFAVVAAYAILLVAGMLADRRRPEIGLLRSRGASTSHVAALAFGEALLLAVPASIAAPFLATGLVGLLGRYGPLAATGAVAGASPSPSTLLVVGLTGLVAAIVLTVPAFASGADVAGIRALLGRPVARTLAQRMGIDVALLAVAALAIWQLRSYGQPLTRDVHGALGLDPLLVAAPAFGLVAGAVLATRLVPRTGEVGERIMRRSRGLVAPLVARQVARRPLRYTRAALLLMLAAALGTFAAVYATTWSSSQAGQAAYAAGADIRVTPGGGTSAWSLGSAYRGIPGVVAALPVARGDLGIGQVVRSGVLLAPDARTAPAIVALPPASEGASLSGQLAALAAARPPMPGILLPDGTSSLRVDFDAALTEKGEVIQTNDAPYTFEIPPDYRGIGVSAVVVDADGLITTFPGAGEGLAGAEPGLFDGGGQTLLIPLDDPGATSVGAGPAGPRRLIGLEFTLASPFPFFANPITGTLHVTGLDTSLTGPSGSAAWTALSLDPAASWQWEETDATGVFNAVGTGPGAVTVPDNDAFASSVVPLRFVPPAPDDPAIPAIGGDRLLALTATDVGQILHARSGGVDIALRIVGHTLEFPTLQPDDPFAIVDGPTLALEQYLTGGSPSAPSEWWLTTEPGESGSVAATLAGPAFRSQAVLERAALLAELESDPVGLGTLGALLLGSLAAAVFAIVGFLVGASVSTRERLTEFALLRALGLSRRQLAGWLAIEHGFLLGVGVVAGTAIGLILAWLIVPATLVGSNGEPVVPVPVLLVPWPLVALTYAIALGLLGATVALFGRPLPGHSVATILRAAED